MATQNKEEPATRKKKKSGVGKLLVIIIVLLVLLLAGGGAAAWWFLVHQKASAAQAHGAKPAPPAAKPAHFINLDRFVTNVQSSDGQTHYLQVQIALKTSSSGVGASLNQLKPEVRSAILDILAAQQASTVTLDATRQKLRQQIQARVNAILMAAGVHGDSPGGPITGVYFSGFVMQ